MATPGITVEEFNAADTAFHVAIARASGNALVAELTTALRNAMQGPLLERLRADRRFESTSARLIEEHRAVYQALVVGDGERAADLVQAHIERFYGLPPGA
jgi:GntR family transcriptional repressor for pyruvate dehydrogenase complex